MQRLGGLLLMLAGASLGAYSLIPPPHDGEEKLREVTRISAAPDRAVRPSAPVTLTVGTSSASSTAAAIDAAPQKASELAAAMPVRPSSTWSAIVSSEPAAQGRLTSSKPGDGEARMQLTRDLQRELQRVGCYEGEITGNWTPSTKRAMSTFMDRVNATLPMEEPDYILLTLVQGHAAAACGAECPAGQAISANGRCVPNAVVAGATRKTLRDEQRRASDEQRIADQGRSAEERRVANETRTVAVKRAEDAKRVAAERRAVGEKKAAEQRAAQLKAKAKAELAAAESVRKERTSQTSKQVVAQAGPEQLPWLNDDQLQTQTANAAQPTRPDGMMSVGGPRVAKAELPDSALSVTPDAGPMPMELDNSGASDGAAAPEDSAAPVLTAPTPVEAKPPAINSSQQGYSGTKSGPAAVRGRAGTKSGVAVRGLPGGKSGVGVRGLTGSKSGAAVQRYSASRASKPRVFAKKRAHPPTFDYRAPKPKYYYFASSADDKYKKSKTYKPHYNMMQALSGGFY